MSKNKDSIATNFIGNTGTMKRCLFYVLIVSFCSCSIQQPIATETSANNQTYKVEYLFEHEGCKVYRFYDRGNYVYFTNCKGEAIAKNDSIEIRNTTKVIPPNK